MPKYANPLSDQILLAILTRKSHLLYQRPCIRGNSCPPECELLCGERVVLFVKDDFGLPEMVPDLPVLGDRRGAEARLPQGDASRSSTMACNIAIAMALLAKDVRV